VKVGLLDDAAAFLAAAGPLLLEDEARHNLQLGVAGTLETSPQVYAEHRLWIVEHEGETVAAALRTPPWNLLLARPRSDRALRALVDGIEEELPGVVGARPEVDSFVELWTSRHRLGSSVERRQGVYALERVQPVPGPPGTARLATRSDRPLLMEWIRAFGEEALSDSDPGRSELASVVEQRLGGPSSGFLLWEDGGAPVSMSGWGGRTPNGIRVGPVYTPPGLRGRGYATALVAEQSQMLLDEGRRFCFLYTDLANPTSNAIYERIGYTRVCDSLMVSFAGR
jgi:predicted GNAT family acetyltransferase